MDKYLTSHFQFHAKEASDKCYRDWTNGNTCRHIDMYSKYKIEYSAGCQTSYLEKLLFKTRKKEREYKTSGRVSVKWTGEHYQHSFSLPKMCTKYILLSPYTSSKAIIFNKDDEINMHFVPWSFGDRSFSPSNSSRLFYFFKRHAQQLESLKKPVTQSLIMESFYISFIFEFTLIVRTKRGLLCTMTSSSFWLYV